MHKVQINYGFKKKKAYIVMILLILTVTVVQAWSAGPNYARSSHTNFLMYRCDLGVNGSANVSGWRYTKVTGRYTAPSGRTKSGSVQNYYGFSSTSFKFRDDLNPFPGYPPTTWSYSYQRSPYQLTP